MKRGLVVGKFLPPHLGHSYLINTAASQCDQLTVLICDHPEYTIPAKLRKSWLEAMHPGVNFIILKDYLDDNDSEGWAENTIKVLGFAPDIVFSSEAYGPGYAKRMGSKHIMVDKPRNIIPISGTAVRADPWKNWQYLDPIVRQYFVKRICLVGSESTGTTTLSQDLAEHYKTNWVPEYGRQYTIDELARLDKQGWKTADFVKIAKVQNQMEDEAAKQANKLLFCDTDSFATSIWHERYMGVRSYQVEQLAAGRQYEIYFLTDVNIPFEQDGIRDGEHLRQWMHERFQQKLIFWDKPFVIITGNREQRLAQAVNIIDQLLTNHDAGIKGLTRNNWHSKGGY